MTRDSLAQRMGWTQMSLSDLRRLCTNDSVDARRAALRDYIMTREAAQAQAGASSEGQGEA